MHSGGRILTVDETADAAVALVGTRRVVRTLPGWRGALIRTSALAPSVARPAADLFAAQGRRRIEKKRPAPHAECGAGRSRGWARSVAAALRCGAAAVEACRV